jgi:hypothetical protein
MNLDWTKLAGIALLGGAIWFGYGASQKDPDCPDGKCPPKQPAKPAPKKPEPKPKPRPRKPWGDCESAGRQAPLSIGASVGGNVHEDGTELHCDLPGAYHRRNTSSWGLGNCVYTSIGHSAEWHNVPALREFAKWIIAKGIPGGGHPQKVDELIPKIAADRGLPTPDYINVTSSDLELLKRACQAGYLVAVTYSKSPTGRYGGSRISHMVSLVHADDRHFVILDNNYPGVDAYEWVTPEEFTKTCQLGGNYWAVILLRSPPPPVPTNRRV